jgi:hypothetical protein
MAKRPRLSRRMWFRRRQAQLDLSALDGLADLVERIVALLPEPGRQQPQPDPAPIQVAVHVPARQPAPPPAPQAAPAPEQTPLLFVASPSGYRLTELDRPVPSRGSRVELAEGSFRVVRHGPSPLPGDRRRCVFLEREEPPAEARTPDG